MNFVSFLRLNQARPAFYFPVIHFPVISPRSLLLMIRHCLKTSAGFDDRKMDDRKNDSISYLRLKQTVRRSGVLFSVCHLASFPLAYDGTLLQNVWNHVPEIPLCHAIYTQPTDVEIEINGLTTYDREVVKPDAKRVTAANQKFYAPPAEK